MAVLPVLLLFAGAVPRGGLGHPEHNVVVSSVHACGRRHSRGGVDPELEQGGGTAQRGRKHPAAAAREQRDCFTCPLGSQRLLQKTRHFRTPTTQHEGRAAGRQGQHGQVQVSGAHAPEPSTPRAGLHPQAGRLPVSVEAPAACWWTNAAGAWTPPWRRSLRQSRGLSQHLWALLPPPQQLQARQPLHEAGSPAP